MQAIGPGARLDPFDAVCYCRIPGPALQEANGKTKPGSEDGRETHAVGQACSEKDAGSKEAGEKTGGSKVDRSQSCARQDGIDPEDVASERRQQELQQSGSAGALPAHGARATRSRPSPGPLACRRAKAWLLRGCCDLRARRPGAPAP